MQVPERVLRGVDVTGRVLPFSAERRRLTNVTGTQTCSTCGDDGLCVVGTEPRPIGHGQSFQAELVGPCPHCERGFAVEFGGTWGSEGYWRGREIPQELLA